MQKATRTVPVFKPKAASWCPNSPTTLIISRWDPWVDVDVSQPKKVVKSRVPNYDGLASWLKRLRTQHMIIDNHWAKSSIFMRPKENNKSLDNHFLRGKLLTHPPTRHDQQGAIKTNSQQQGGHVGFVQIHRLKNPEVLSRQDGYWKVMFEQCVKYESKWKCLLRVGMEIKVWNHHPDRTGCGSNMVWQKWTCWQVKHGSWNYRMSIGICTLQDVHCYLYLWVPNE